MRTVLKDFVFTKKDYLVLDEIKRGIPVTHSTTFYLAEKYNVAATFYGKKLQKLQKAKLITIDKDKMKLSRGAFKKHYMLTDLGMEFYSLINRIRRNIS